MLSEHELHRLNEIERELRITDPGLAASLSTMSHQQRWPMPLAVWGWAIFAVVAMMGWWIVAVMVFGLLIPVTFLALVDLPEGTHNGYGQPRGPLG